jgi:glutaredoxin 3
MLIEFRPRNYVVGERRRHILITKTKMGNKQRKDEERPVAASQSGGINWDLPVDVPNEPNVMNAFIARNKIAVFSKSYCPYCTRAKNLLKERGLLFEALELDQRQDGSDIQAELQKITGQRTVPNIFINGSSIGGCDDLFALDKKGKLKV